MTDQNEIFQEIDTHLLQDKCPSAFLNLLSQEAVFQTFPFELLYRQKQTEQSPLHHPEGSVWNHTMLVTDAAASMKQQSRSPRVFLWAALLHDIGKPDTTRIRKGKVTSYDHDKVGANLAREFLSQFTDDSQFIGSVGSLVRWHMQILFVVNGMPFADVKAMKHEVDIREVALLGFCDRLGRLGANREKEEKNIRTFLEKCGSSF